MYVQTLKWDLAEQIILPLSVFRLRQSYPRRAHIGCDVLESTRIYAVTMTFQNNILLYIAI